MTQWKQYFGVRQLTTAAMLTAIVVVLQLLGSFIRFGTFSISLVLVPIVIGAALLGPWIGAWLGFVFSVMVLVSGDAALFLTISAFGTVLTVILKGTLAGLISGFVYKLLQNRSQVLATGAAALVCPIVNTGIFLIGCRLFFWEWVAETAAGAGFESVTAFAFLGLVGANFLFELLVNVVLAPVIVKLVSLAERNR